MAFFVFTNGTNVNAVDLPPLKKLDSPELMRTLVGNDLKSVGM